MDEHTQKNIVHGIYDCHADWIPVWQAIQLRLPHAMGSAEFVSLGLRLESIVFCCECTVLLWVARRKSYER